MRLSQAIAEEKQTKATTYQQFGELHKINQKPSLFNGQTRRYEPLAEDGTKLPAEDVVVQCSVRDVIRMSRKILGDFWDALATKEFGNLTAQGAITLDDFETTLLPVTFLLSIEKQLTDVRTFISELPVLDPAETWTLVDDFYESGETWQMRTAKVQKAIVLYPATTEHAAQTQLVTEDQQVGQWKTKRKSGAIPMKEKRAMLERVDKLLLAAKKAREEANTTQITKIKVSEGILDYIFGEQP